MRGSLGFVMGVAWMVAAAAPSRAQEATDERTRPIRVGNLNVTVVGFGYAAHEHPTYDDHFFLGISYQRRILQRELRAVPLWVRGALQFTEDDMTTDSTFTYWPSTGDIPYPERVQEQTSDFTVRAELLIDALHNKNAALYAGGGVAIHLVSYTSRGLTSGRNNAAGLETDENRIAPSAVAGARFFSAKHPYTFYGEARYGFTYGRATGPQDQKPPGVPRIEGFDVESSNNVSFEAGLGLHW
ncbi:MAG TPA: hypothetical protein VFD07_07195 [Candidatus Krumholzibacteria bacterium]|nr:hypothetical protein [Candidatus Krumholzibacteria bacterium]